MSGSKCSPEIGAALFRRPTSSSNSDANTDDASCFLSPSWSRKFTDRLPAPDTTSSDGADASFRCCR
uniref:Uncharacterized protein n=1 Tax=Cynoglossus semilaevis TaxID=244447 RepID=A0A3P8VTA9_CYNSE